MKYTKCTSLHIDVNRKTVFRVCFTNNGILRLRNKKTVTSFSKGKTSKTLETFIENHGEQLFNLNPTLIRNADEASKNQLFIDLREKAALLNIRMQFSELNLELGQKNEI